MSCFDKNIHITLHILHTLQGFLNLPAIFEEIVLIPDQSFESPAFPNLKPANIAPAAAMHFAIVPNLFLSLSFWDVNSTLSELKLPCIVTPFMEPATGLNGTIDGGVIILSIFIKPISVSVVFPKFNELIS